MRLVTHLDQLSSLDGSLVTIGNFDGVHIGHQALITQAIHLAKDKHLQDIVLSFEPHPRSFLTHDQHFRLTTSTQKRELFERLGCQIYVELLFDESLSHLSGYDFIKQILHEKLHARYILVGTNFYFGHHKSGDVTLLEKCQEEFGYELICANLSRDNISEYSSSRLRATIAQNDFVQATHILGRPWVIPGKLIYTANGTEFKAHEDIIHLKQGKYQGILRDSQKREISIQFNVTHKPTYSIICDHIVAPPEGPCELAPTQFMVRD